MKKTELLLLIAAYLLCPHPKRSLPLSHPQRENVCCSTSYTTTIQSSTQARSRTQENLRQLFLPIAISSIFLSHHFTSPPLSQPFPAPGTIFSICFRELSPSWQYCKLSLNSPSSSSNVYTPRYQILAEFHYRCKTNLSSFKNLCSCTPWVHWRSLRSH